MSAAPPNDCCAALDGPLTRDRPAGEPISEAILEAVSVATDRPLVPTDTGPSLPPLFDTIDPEALDRLVDHAETRGTDFSLSFEYDGCQVTVSLDEIVIEPHPDAR